jgi:hypothetical protein
MSSEKREHPVTVYLTEHENDLLNKMTKEREEGRSQIVREALLKRLYGIVEDRAAINSLAKGKFELQKIINGMKKDLRTIVEAAEAEEHDLKSLMNLTLELREKYFKEGPQ